MTANYNVKGNMQEPIGRNLAAVEKVSKAVWRKNGGDQGLLDIPVSLQFNSKYTLDGNSEKY